MSFVPLYRINAFIVADTSTPLRSGNPAAVALLTSSQSQVLADEVRQTLAKELNLAETAFVVRTETPGTFKLRWFTPQKEVELCGHATLASAHALLAADWVTPGSTVTFSTLSGNLSVSTTDLEKRRFEMTFPLLSRREELNAARRGRLLSALRVNTADVVSTFCSDYDVMVVVGDERALLRVRPNMEELSSFRTRGVIVATVMDSQPKVIVSRFFAPACGINEDPVTGSAHCALAAEFIEEGGEALGRQASSRGGEILMKRTKDEKVKLDGMSYLVFRGEVFLDM